MLLAEGFDRQLTEDLVQEITSRWFRKHMQFESPGAMYIWLVRSIPFVLMEWRKRKQRHPDALDVAKPLEE
jgi:DNA-directed RNA polymerase specialized sigma24 family protein